MTSRGDGCADLTIRATGQTASGSATSNLNVSLGSGRNLSIQIVSDQLVGDKWTGISRATFRDRCDHALRLIARLADTIAT